MATIIKSFTFSSGATISASEHNTNFDTLYTLVNGNIDNANIKTAAGIAYSKLTLTNSVVLDDLASAIKSGNDATLVTGTKGSDGDLAQWNADGDLVGGGTGVPTATVFPFAGSTAPTGFLLCYGQAVSRSTYSALFTAVSTTYGAGNGSTTFNVPDLRGRTIIALDNMGGTSANRVTATQADSLGGASGAETHTLSIAEMPAHTHPVTTEDNTGGTGLIRTAANGLDSVTATGSTGGGGAHNNMQPYMAMNYIIKT